MVNKTKYDFSDFIKAIALLHEYKVGDNFFILRDNKIIPVVLYEVTFNYCDRGMTHTVANTLLIKLTLTALYGGSKINVMPSDLYRTREEAAEAFLDRNEIPKKLLQVLNPPKPRTTIGDLIDKLQVVDPEIDLGKDFWKVLKPITKVIENPETTPEYWDCECEKEYIHPAGQPCCTKCGAVREDCPDSRLAEIKPENMHRG